MRTREILIISAIIIAVCVVSLIPFRNTTDNLLPKSLFQVNGTAILENIKEGLAGNTTGNTSGNTTTPPATTTPATTTKPPNNNLSFPITINTNVDFITAIVYVLSQPNDVTKDRLSVYNVQSSISKFNTQNSATLLSEMSNPNNLTDSRLFLEYMNWFASHCPLDSDVCTGLC